MGVTVSINGADQRPDPGAGESHARQSAGQTLTASRDLRFLLQEVLEKTDDRSRLHDWPNGAVDLADYCQ